MRRKIMKFGVPIIFIISVIIAIVVYISIHNNKKAVINLDYSDLRGLDYSNKSQSYWNTDGAFDVAAAENGYYYVTMENMLVYFDIETKDVVPVCAKPECLHDTFACNAYLGPMCITLSIFLLTALSVSETMFPPFAICPWKLPRARSSRFCR